jgi:vacuolar-type H+-ATPase subunit B/Vma2
VQKLQTHYGYTDTVDLINLLQEFQNCTPDDDTQCPDIWFMVLEHLHSEIVKAGSTRRPDQEIIARTITKAPNMYQTVTEVIMTMDTTEEDALCKVKKHYVNFGKDMWYLNMGIKTMRH